MRRVLVWLLSVAAIAGALPTRPGSRARAADGDEGPAATRVVVRGQTDLAAALRAATHPAWTSGRQPGPVLVVIDVTPNTQGGREGIAAALAALERDAPAVPGWALAALGERPAAAAAGPGDLSQALDDVLAAETDVVSTLDALETSIKKWREKDGLVLYLADWHFEDDAGLEDFIGGLEKRGLVLSVVGTEAACGRGWNDGFRDLEERVEEDVRGFAFEDYWDGVGRDPFGRSSAKAPWHGGDTPYPYAPYRWDRLLWETTFSQSDWDLADLDAEIDDLLGGLPPEEFSDAMRRLGEAHVALVEARDALAAASPGSPEAERLAARVAALEAEIAELEAKAGLGADDAPDGDAEPSLEDLEARRDEVSQELGALLDAMLATDDPAELARIEAERQRLQAELEQLANDIARRRGEEALPPDLPDLPGMPGGEEVPDPENLRRRLPGGAGLPDPDELPFIDPDEDRYTLYPLPSSYGPYGLMRAAGVTGGRYVLYSWNPSGRKNVVLEYSRCNLFPPDLRSRDEIRKGIEDNPWASAMLRAWWRILDVKTEILEHTPPLRENLRSANEMERAQVVEFLSGIWENTGEQKRYVKYAQRSIDALDAAIAILDEGLAAGGEPKTPVEQRYEAEASLFRHTARVVRFELAECIQAAGLIDRQAWHDRNDHGVIGWTWVPRGRDPKSVRTRADPGAFDPAAGAPLLEERKALLERFRGTPFGEQLAMNDIETARPTNWERVDRVGPSGRAPTESVDPPKPTPRPPGTSSGAGGPSSGGG